MQLANWIKEAIEKGYGRVYQVNCKFHEYLALKSFFDDITAEIREVIIVMIVLRFAPDDNIL